MLVEVKRISKAEVSVVSSLDVAETFGKEHKNILRDIEELNCSEEFRKLNFELSKYSVENNKRNYPMYYMTRDGFTILVMGYTGEKAMRFKEAYIKQFNVMEKALQGKLIEREKGIAMLCKSIKKISSQENSQPFSFKRFSGFVRFSYEVNIILKTSKRTESNFAPSLLRCSFPTKFVVRAYEVLSNV